MMRSVFTLLLIPCFLLADFSEERIKALEARIYQLEYDHNDSSVMINDMQIVVDEVEKKSFTDIVDFTPEVRLRFDKMKYKVGDFE